MNDETLARIERVLTEIRDIQTAHFERYREFTSVLMDSDAKARQAAAARAKDEERWFAEQQAYQDEMRRNVRNSQWVAIGSTVALLLVIGLGFFGFVASRLLP